MFSVYKCPLSLFFQIDTAMQCTEGRERQFCSCNISDLKPRVEIFPDGVVLCWLLCVGARVVTEMREIKDVWGPTLSHTCPRSAQSPLQNREMEIRTISKSNKFLQFCAVITSPLLSSPIPSGVGRWWCWCYLLPNTDTRLGLAWHYYGQAGVRPRSGNFIYIYLVRC